MYGRPGPTYIGLNPDDDVRFRCQVHVPDMFTKVKRLTIKDCNVRFTLAA